MRLALSVDGTVVVDHEANDAYVRALGQLIATARSDATLLAVIEGLTPADRDAVTAALGEAREGLDGRIALETEERA